MTEKIKIGKYANIKLDRWFKRSFGTEKNKRLLQLLLMELIPEHDFERIDFAQQEYTNPSPYDYKSSRVDVNCRDSDGTMFVVEMQMGEQDNFYERVIYNSTFPVQEQVERGVTNNDFPTVYMVSLMNFSCHVGSDQVLFRGRLRFDGDGEIMSDRLQFIFLELPNCRRALSPGATVLEKFCYSLHNIENLEDIPDGFEAELIKNLFRSAEIANFTAQERKEYRKAVMTEHDRIMSLRFAERKGLKQGLEQGIKQGIEQGIKQGLEQAKERELLIARNFKNAGINVKIIAQATGLTVEQVEALDADSDSRSYSK